MAQSDVMKKESDAIEEIRRQNPTVGAYALARQIRLGIVKSAASTTIAVRPYFSTLSVIRRYDARVKNAVAQAQSAAVGV